MTTHNIILATTRENKTKFRNVLQVAHMITETVFRGKQKVMLTANVAMVFGL